MCGINRSVTPETFQIVHKHSHLFFYSSHIQSLLNLIISLLFLGRRRRERFVRRFRCCYIPVVICLPCTHTHTHNARECMLQNGGCALCCRRAPRGLRRSPFRMATYSILQISREILLAGDVRTNVERARPSISVTGESRTKKSFQTFPDAYKFNWSFASI